MFDCLSQVFFLNVFLRCLRWHHLSIKWNHLAVISLVGSLATHYQLIAFATMSRASCIMGICL